MSQDERSWQAEMKQWLTSAAASVDNVVDYRWRQLRRKLGIEGVPQIQPYFGYSNGQQLWLHGRVLTNPPAALPDKDADWWENLTETMQRFASQEVPDIKIAITVGDQTHHTTTDQEGYYHLQVDHKWEPNSTGLWSTAIQQIVDCEHVSAEQSTITSRFLTPTTTAEFGVISDVDDTIMYTEVTQLLTTLKLTFFSNARTRTPLAGVAAFYQALQTGNHLATSPAYNPIFYVSSSPWNLFDMLEDFIELNDIPLGPILLRDLGFDENKFLASGHGHKLDKVRRLMHAYPDLPFVLIGDSGQQDAELYANAAEEFGERIKLILIRDINPQVTDDFDERVTFSKKRAESAGVPMHLIKDSLQGAEHANELGLLHQESLGQIKTATVRDKSPSDG